jgi:hypothetical protein
MRGRSVERVANHEVVIRSIMRQERLPLSIHDRPKGAQ